MKALPTLCPSAPLEPGVVLLGVVLTNGRVAYAGERLELGDDFIGAVSEVDSPERMFRFAGPCRQTGCQQWTGTRCGVASALLDANPHIQAEEKDPECSIRQDCRWFSQEGKRACAICSYVITDSRQQPLAEVGA